MLHKLLIAGLLLDAVWGGQLHKLCTDKIDRDSCQQIERDPEMKCQPVASKTDCILDIDRDLPTFTVVTAEEAYLAAARVNQSTTVIAEIQGENDPYRTVVIVKSGYIGGFEGLRGLHFCHPGYNHDESITKSVLEEVDWKVIKLPCNNLTITEQQFESLAMTFGSSCRPGTWTQDIDLDARLKKQYSSLCELCGPNGCSTTYTSPLNATLTCLTQNGGDVALTDLQYAQIFFSIGSNAQFYQYLCPNGTLAPSSNPCIWTSQLNRLILTSNSSVHVVQTYLKTKMPSFIDNSDGSDTMTEVYLQKLLDVIKSDRINLLTTPLPLHSYVSERRTLPVIEDNIQCNLTLKLSVTSDIESEKCSWLQQASLSTGLQPVLECDKSLYNDTVSNLENIKNGEADFAFVDANFGYIAKKKNLVIAAYPETDDRQLSRIVMVVLNNNTNWVNDIGSLKEKRICLPEFGGKEWLSFIDLLHSKEIVNRSCDYARSFSQFVGVSCVPGAKAKDIDITLSAEDKEKLCSNCIPIDNKSTQKNCNADETNKYYGSHGALLCLKENAGDYAVISLNDLPPHFLKNKGNQEEFRVIRKNGSLAAYSGLDVDDEAPINIITSGEITVKSDNSKFNDIVLFLREIEYFFGQKMNKPFKVFEAFNHTKDLLFPDSTPGLTFDDNSSYLNMYIKNFKTLLQNSDNCSIVPTNTSNKISISFMFITFMTILKVLM